MHDHLARPARRHRGRLAAVAFAGAALAACGGGGGGSGAPAPRGNAVVGAPTMAPQLLDLPRGLPNGLEPVRFLETADVDGDGDLDLLVASRLFRNHGGGTFAAMPQSPPSVSSWFAAASFGDVDDPGARELRDGYAHGAARACAGGADRVRAGARHRPGERRRSFS
jgi:hypothetical protein